ncbi:MAG: hypothetical protein ACAF41_31215 [Leptolyngbya sp. BL-A-14]
MQTRYPTSGLLTELVQTHADQFVVRAIVQLGSMTLATSLASAGTVEQAEDQSRLRVLSLLGIYPDVHPAPFVSFPAVSVPSTSTSMTSPGSAFKDTTLPSVSTHNLTHLDSVTPSALPNGAVPDNDAIAPLSSFATTFEPASLTGSSQTAFSDATVKASGLTPDLPDTASKILPETASDTWEAPLDEALLDEGPPDQDEVPYDGVTYDEEPYDAYKPLVEYPDLAVAPEESLPAVAETAPPKNKPRKSSASKELPVSDVDTAESTSRDLSSLISQIGVEIDRIGWSKRQGSTYLQKTYGKKTRSELTDDELEDFLNYLNTQPSAGEG